MSKSIKEIADLIGVSKTAIRNHMTEEFREKHTEKSANGMILVSDEGVAKLQTLLESNCKVVETTANQFPESSANQFSAEREKWYMEQIDELRKENKELKDKLVELSADVGTSLKALTQGNLADKLIEGKTLLDETSATSTKKEPFIKRIAKAIIGE